MIAHLVQSLLDGLSRLGYPGIFVLMALESSVVPVPSELVMAPAGYLAAKGQLDPVWVVVAGTLGGLVGALANYWLAAWIGEPLLRKYGKYLLISERHLDQSERFFLRHGEIGTFLGRFVPVVRHLISIPAGVARMRLGRFALFTALGAGAWGAILTWIGWVVGQHSGELSAAVDQAFTSQAHHWLLYRVLPGMVLILVGYVVWLRRRDRRDPAGQGTPDVAAFQFRIRGMVQGVGFRWFVARHATALHLVGYARNLPDGTVEVVAAGDLGAIDRLAAELGRGPEFARVDAVEKAEKLLEVDHFKSFDIW